MEPFLSSEDDSLTFGWSNGSYSPVIDCNTFCYQVAQFRQRFEPAEEEGGGRGEILWFGRTLVCLFWLDVQEGSYLECVVIILKCDD